VVPTALCLVTALVAGAHTFPPTALSTRSYDWLDADILLWDFWWARRAVAELTNPYWTELLFWPRGTSLALHIHPLPYELLSLPFQLALPGVTGLVVALNVVVFLSFLSSALGAYLLALRTTGSRAAAAVAGLAFACMPFRFLNMVRLHTIATDFLVWYAVLWLRFVDRPSRGRAVALGACLAGIWYTSPEYALHAVGFSILWVLWHARSLWGRRASVTAGLALAAVVFLVLSAPLLAEQARAIHDGQVVSAASMDEAKRWSPALLSFVTPSRFHPLYGQLFASAGEYGTPGVNGMRSESSIPLTVWILALIALRHRRRDDSAFWLVAAAAFLVLSLGPFLRITGTWATSVPLPYAALYAWVPPLRAARDPTRFVPAAMLALSVAAAFGLRAVLRRVRSRNRTWAAAGVAGALVVFECATPRARTIRAQDLIDPGYSAIAGVTGSFAVLDLNDDPAALLAQTWHGRPVTSGAVSIPRSVSAGRMLPVEASFRRAPQLLARDPAARAAAVAAARRELEELRIRFVVLRRSEPAALELAREIGLKVVSDGDVVIYERLMDGSP
jgi:hypothetical protein